jgi:hypothetical protein
MRKHLAILTIPLLLLFAGSCYFDYFETVAGNGKVVKEQRSVPDFNELKVATGIDVIITQSDKVEVMVEADENLMDWIKTEVVNNELKIYTEKSIRSAKEKKVYVNFRKLNEIHITSAGDVSSENTLVTDELNIEMSSAGNLTLAVEADKVDIDISSAGSARLSGKTNNFNADLSSAGDLNAYNLEAKVGDISVSSIGNAKVFITEEASFRCSSAGDIDYKGEPILKSIRTSSAGSVNKK